MKIIILLLSVNSLFAKDCFETTTKIIYMKKAEIETVTLCKNKTSDKMLFYTSASCLNNKCEILKRTKKKIAIPDYTGSIGSPGFKLCQSLGGIPQIFDFQDESKLWKNSERCFFGREDFVEISLLTHNWKNYIH